MVSRRLVLSGLLGLAGSALFDIAIGAAATGEAALPEGTARALDQVDVAFSQRPQLYYNRKRQFRPRQHNQPWRAPRLRRSRGRVRPRRPASPS